MILLANIETVIDCPVAKLFNYVTDMENYLHWFPGVINISSYNNLTKNQIGKQYIETLEFPSGMEKLIIQVAKYEKNRLFTTEGNLELVLPMMTMNFKEETENSCHFTLSYFSRNTELDTDNSMLKTIQTDLKHRLPTAINKLKEAVL